MGTLIVQFPFFPLSFDFPKTKIFFFSVALLPPVLVRLLFYRTPLTHQRFLRRYRGSYGPAIVAGDGSATFPFPSTPVQGLLLCGDSCFPGIGVPAVAGSGLLAAHSVDLKSLRPQLKLLERLRESK